MSLFGTEQPHKPTDNVEVTPAYSHDVAPAAGKRAQIVPVGIERANIATAYMMKSLPAEQTVSRFVVQPRPAMPVEAAAPVQAPQPEMSVDQEEFLEGFSKDVAFKPADNVIDEAAMIEAARQEVVGAQQAPAFEPQSTFSPYSVPTEVPMGPSSNEVKSATYADNIYREMRQPDTLVSEAPAPTPEVGSLNADEVRMTVNAAFEETSSSDPYTLAA